MNLFKGFFPPEVFCFISDRRMDFHFDKSAPSFTNPQRKYLKSKAGLDIKRCFNIKQIHGRRIIVATKRGFNNPKRILRADGVLTKEKGIPLAVRTADCANIFLYDPKIKGIGLLHAGWRSTKKKIALRSVRLMRKIWKSNPKDIRAALGPCIRPCCCEVRANFKKFFPKETKEISGRFYFDLAAANRNQLLAAGILPRHIKDCGLCTYHDKRFFSYRRERDRAGRMISVMIAKNSA